MSHSKPNPARNLPPDITQLPALPQAGTLAPSPWVLRWLDGVTPGGRVLDFACGSGRHARAALARGHRVCAVDRDADALAVLAASAEAGASDAALEVRQCDLERGRWQLPAAAFDAVIVSNYLFRPRFALLCMLLAPGGLLIYETFGRGNELYGRPTNPDFLLREGELIARAQAAGLQVRAYESGRVSRPRPAVVQRLCATRPQAGSAKLAVLATDLP